MNFNAALIYFALILSTSADDSCKAPNGRAGNCVVVQRCREIYEAVKAPEAAFLTRYEVIDLVRQLHCGYQGKDPKICCARPNDQLSAQQAEQTSQPDNYEQNLNIKINSAGMKVTAIEGEDGLQEISIDSRPIASNGQISSGLGTRPIVTNGLVNSAQGFKPVAVNYPESSGNQESRPLVINNAASSARPNKGTGRGSRPISQMILSSQSDGSVNLQITDSFNKLSVSSQKTKLLPDNCGKSLQFKYFVGNNTELDDFPWIVILDYQTPLGRRKGCGGALINSRYVLTAGHCVVGLRPNWRLVGVHLGKYNINANQDCVQDGEGPSDVVCSEPQQVAIEEQVVHPEYTVATSDGKRANDIALLRLAAPVPSIRNIDSICLPAKAPIPQIFLASGWGKTLYNDGQDRKRMTGMRLREGQACAEQGLRLTRNQFCANARLLENSCIPDEGGPLMGVEEKPDRSRRTTVFGILSYIRSPNSVHCSASNAPAVYTSVLDYVPWILRSIKE